MAQVSVGVVGKIERKEMKMRERKHLFWWLPRVETFVRAHKRKVKPLPQTYWVGKGSHAYLKDKK